MGQRVVDQTGNAREEAQEDDDDDGAIERAESGLFGTVGRNDRGAYDITAFALAVSDFSHDRLFSMARAMFGRLDNGLKRPGSERTVLRFDTRTAPQSVNFTPCLKTGTVLRWDHA